MYRFRVTTVIAAPRERCFDLARSVEVHVQTSKATGEKAVGTKASGLLELGDEVTWQGTHFGMIQRLTSRITAWERPNHLQDRMIRGAFRELLHDHYFEATADGMTTMVDVVEFTTPLGLIGWLVERTLIGPHLRQFIKQRGLTLKSIAESDDWGQYLSRP